jgi:hypothetical protein
MTLAARYTLVSGMALLAMVAEQPPSARVVAPLLALPLLVLPPLPLLPLPLAPELPLPAPLLLVYPPLVLPLPREPLLPPLVPLLPAVDPEPVEDPASPSNPESFCAPAQALAHALPTARHKNGMWLRIGIGGLPFPFMHRRSGY